MQLEPHFHAVFNACRTARYALEVLPDNDLLNELKVMFTIQNEIFMHMIEGKHYGTDNITMFMGYCQSIKEQASRIKESL